MGFSNWAQGFSSCSARAPECKGSTGVVHGLSCPLAGRILVLRPRIKPMSAALAGRFLTPGPPVKSLPCSFGLFTLEGASCHAVRMVTPRREDSRSPDNSQHQFASQPRKDKHHCMFVLSCSVSPTLCSPSPQEGL